MVAALLIVTGLGLSGYYVAGRLFGTERRNQALARVLGPLARIPAKHVALVLAIVLTFAVTLSLETPAPFVVLVLFLLTLFVMTWAREFRLLMDQPDSAFPGSRDKLIWALLLIVLPPVGVWLFRDYRLANVPEAKPGRFRVGDEAW